MKRIWTISLLALLVLVSPASAEFYRYTDPHGNVIFTDDLSKVPKAQRSQAKMYEESVSQTPPSNAPEMRPDEKSSSPASGEMDSLEAEGRRLLSTKERLDEEYKELAAENAKLKSEQKEAVTPDQIKAVNKKVVGFNTRFQAFQEKNAAYQAEAEAYNKRVREAESKSQPEDTGKSQ